MILRNHHAGWGIVLTIILLVGDLGCFEAPRTNPFDPVNREGTASGPGEQQASVPGEEAVTSNTYWGRLHAFVEGLPNQEKPVQILVDLQGHQERYRANLNRMVTFYVIGLADTTTIIRELSFRFRHHDSVPAVLVVELVPSGLPFRRFEARLSYREVYRQPDGTETVLSASSSQGTITLWRDTPSNIHTNFEFEVTLNNGSVRRFTDGWFALFPR